MKIDFAKACTIGFSSDEIAANRHAARARGLPDIASRPAPALNRLAIVGAGPSVARHVNALRNWKGTVWAINDAALWCAKQKIKCALFSIDANTTFDPAIANTVTRAVVATRCNPVLFDLLRAADVTTFDLPERELGPGSSPSACIVGTRLGGFRDVTFFGCESSYAPGSLYVYGHWDGIEDKGILVTCAGSVFLTHIAYLSAALAIALTIRQHGAHVHERSGGLLAALVRAYDYDVIGIAPGIASAGTDPDMIAEYRNYLTWSRHEEADHPAAGRPATGVRGLQGFQ